MRLDSERGQRMAIEAVLRLLGQRVPRNATVRERGQVTITVLASAIDAVRRAIEQATGEPFQVSIDWNTLECRFDGAAKDAPPLDEESAQDATVEVIATTEGEG